MYLSIYIYFFYFLSISFFFPLGVFFSGYPYFQSYYFITYKYIYVYFFLFFYLSKSRSIIYFPSSVLSVVILLFKAIFLLPTRIFMYFLSIHVFFYYLLSVITFLPQPSITLYQCRHQLETHNYLAFFISKLSLYLFPASVVLFLVLISFFSLFLSPVLPMTPISYVYSIFSYFQLYFSLPSYLPFFQ